MKICLCFVEDGNDDNSRIDITKATVVVWSDVDQVGFLTLPMEELYQRWLLPAVYQLRDQAADLAPEPAAGT